VRSITRRFTIFFNIALLRSGEIVVEEKKIGVHRRGRSCNFLQLARADQSGGVGPVAALQDFADNSRACTSGQRAQFRQRFVCVEFWNARLVAGLSRGMGRNPCFAFRCWRSRRRIPGRLRLWRSRCPSRRVRACAHQIPTRNARSCKSSGRGASAPRGTRPATDARLRVFLG